MSISPDTTQTSHGVPFPENIGAVLTVNLDHLAENYKTLSQLSAPAKCAVAVKADAYGCGLENVVAVLVEQGCEVFFVAELSEALRARLIAPEAEIFVLNGLPKGAAAFYLNNGLTPVLNTSEELDDWLTTKTQDGAYGAFALHFDTGMNRLGLSHEEAEKIATHLKNKDIKPSLVMSHFACADEPDHPLNQLQKERFQALTQHFEGVRLSLSNSAGIMMGDSKYDLTRAGLALYGANPDTTTDWPVKRVMSLHAPVLQIRQVKEGETIGYGASYKAKKTERVAIVAAGYADGFLRAASCTDNRPHTDETCVAFSNKAGKIWHLNLLGRVSMDLIAVDVSDVPESEIMRGAMVELFGDTIAIEQLAQSCNTIAYELLTSSSRRAERHYIWPHAMLDMMS